MTQTVAPCLREGFLAGLSKGGVPPAMGKRKKEDAPPYPGLGGTEEPPQQKFGALPQGPGQWEPEGEFGYASKYEDPVRVGLWTLTPIFSYCDLSIEPTVVPLKKLSLCAKLKTQCPMSKSTTTMHRLEISCFIFYNQARQPTTETDSRWGLVGTLCHCPTLL